jgi:hypothetical protein
MNLIGSDTVYCTTSAKLYVIGNVNLFQSLHYNYVSHSCLKSVYATLKTSICKDDDNF